MVNVFPTRTRLARMFQIDYLAYPICGLDEESMGHLFFYCLFVAHLWMVFQWNLNIIARLGLSFFEWCVELWRIEDYLLDKNLLNGYIGCLMDVVWQARNGITHGAPIPSFVEFHPGCHFCFCLPNSPCFLPLCLVGPVGFFLWKGGLS